MKKPHLVHFEVGKLRRLKKKAKKRDISFAALLRLITDAWLEKEDAGALRE